MLIVERETWLLEWGRRLVRCWWSRQLDSECNRITFTLITDLEELSSSSGGASFPNCLLLSLQKKKIQKWVSFINIGYRHVRSTTILKILDGKEVQIYFSLSSTEFWDKPTWLNRCCCWWWWRWWPRCWASSTWRSSSWRRRPDGGRSCSCCLVIGRADSGRSRNDQPRWRSSSGPRSWAGR